MAIFPEPVEMVIRAVLVIGHVVDNKTNQWTKGYKEEKIPPHTDTSRVMERIDDGPLLTRHQNVQIRTLPNRNIGLNPRQGKFFPNHYT